MPALLLPGAQVKCMNNLPKCGINHFGGVGDGSAACLWVGSARYAHCAAHHNYTMLAILIMHSEQAAVKVAFSARRVAFCV